MKSRRLDESIGEGSVSSSNAGSQRPVQAAPALPPEIWCKILEPHKDDIRIMIKCRLLSPQAKDVADDKLDKKFKNFKNELNFLTKPNELIDEPVFVTRISSQMSLDRFLNEMTRLDSNKNTHPFPTRWLSFSVGKTDYDIGPVSNMVYHRFCELATMFGKEVHRLEFNMTGYQGLTQLTQNVFPNFPNLRQLDLAMFIPGWEAGCNSSAHMLRLIKSITFSPLPHLHTLKLWMQTSVEEPLGAEILKNYGNNVQTLVVVALSTVSKFFQTISPDMVPNVTNLQIKAVPIRIPDSPYGRKGMHNQPVYRFLRSGNWALKQFSLYFQGEQRLGRNTLANVFKIANQHSTTLEILHLYLEERYFDQSACMSREKFVKKFKPEVKFPLLKEFSLYEKCFTRDVAEHLSSICNTKMKNLCTIHVCRDEDITPRCCYSRYEEELILKWWGHLQRDSKLLEVVMYSGNEFDNNVVGRLVFKLPNFDVLDDFLRTPGLPSKESESCPWCYAPALDPNKKD